MHTASHCEAAVAAPAPKAAQPSSMMNHQFSTTLPTFATATTSRARAAEPRPRNQPTRARLAKAAGAPQMRAS